MNVKEKFDVRLRERKIEKEDKKGKAEHSIPFHSISLLLTKTTIAIAIAIEEAAWTSDALRQPHPSPVEFVAPLVASVPFFPSTTTNSSTSRAKQITSTNVDSHRRERQEKEKMEEKNKRREKTKRRIRIRNGREGRERRER